MIKKWFLFELSLRYEPWQIWTEFISDEEAKAIIDSWDPLNPDFEGIFAYELTPDGQKLERSDLGGGWNY